MKNQEKEKSLIAKHTLSLNHTIKTIRWLKNVNNLKELNIREAIIMYNCIRI